LASKKNKKPKIVWEEPKVENHMQVFARLTKPHFNQGSMHGTPGMRKPKGGGK